MPATKTSHPIRIKIYDINSQLLEGATVTLTLGTNTPISVTSNSKGEAVLNVANAGDWSVDDEVTLTATKTGEGTKTSTLVLTSSPQETSLTLAETSDLIYYEQSETDTYVLNFALLTTYDGEKVTKSNPLPIQIINSAGEVVKITQLEENRLGSECTGSDGATGRVLTLANTAESGGPVSVWAEDQLISQSDLTISHKSASSTITFAVEVFNTDTIKVLYYV